MSNYTYSYGELRPLAHDARRQPPTSTTAKTTATNGAAVMSAQERRFWARVDKNGTVNSRRPELGPCWIWTGSRYSHKRRPTYGQTSYDGRRTTAHRASFLMHGGVVPDGYDVMHLCDTKPCVRPTHLTAGTRSENLFDGFANPANKGVCAGENNRRARLDRPRVDAIRAASAVGMSYADLSRQYGVSATQIRNIVLFLRWPDPSPAEAVA